MGTGTQKGRLIRKKTKVEREQTGREVERRKEKTAGETKKGRKG